MATTRIAFGVVFAASVFMVCACEDLYAPEVLDGQCQNLSIELGTALGNFDRCALDHSQPFKMCLQCAAVYEHARKLFSDVIHFRTPLSKQCRDLIVGGRVSLVNVNYEHLEYVWKKQGICEECFVPGSFNLTDQVAGFYTLRNQLNGCINETRDSNSTCSTCHHEYRKLTKYFDHLLHFDIARRHHMCLDMVDAMNRTRSVWGDQCFRSQRVPSEVLLFLGVLTFIASWMFYWYVRNVLGAKETELAEPHTLRSVLLSRSGEFGAIFRERRTNLLDDSNDDSVESDIVRRKSDLGKSAVDDTTVIAESARS